MSSVCKVLSCSLVQFSARLAIDETRLCSLYDAAAWFDILSTSEMIKVMLLYYKSCSDLTQYLRELSLTISTKKFLSPIQLLLIEIESKLRLQHLQNSVNVYTIVTNRNCLVSIGAFITSKKNTTNFFFKLLSGLDVNSCLLARGN